MATTSITGGRSKNLILAAMIFAVSMTFIDQTIVSIAVPEIQKELGLSSTGVQWAVNAYLLSLAALFAFGGRLADTVGHKKMVVLGVIVFALASTMCGLTPKGSLAEAWIVTFRVVQGAGGAIMFPAALAIVVQTFALHERGQGVGRLLRDRRRPHRGGPDPRGLPHPVDLAGHLLGQRPGGGHRPGPDRPGQAGHVLQARPDGLPRIGPDRLGCGPERLRLPAGGHLGVGQPGGRTGHREPAWSC